MKNINLKNVLLTLTPITVVLYLLFMNFGNVSQNPFVFFLGTISKVISFELILLYLFSNYFWKHPLFKGWLVPFPNLQGTWKGTIQSTWINPETNERVDPIPAILTIKQSFFNISCVMRTAEMCSRSVTSSFILDKDNQIKRLIYSYDSNPLQTVKDRSPNHCGTMSFNIIEKPFLKIDGGYWTGRKTMGEIEMTFWKKELLDYYPDELGKHPVSGD